MGIVFNSAAIIAAALTGASLHFGASPLLAFLIGAVLLYAPIKLLLPFGSKKIVSETGIIASVGVVFFYVFNHMALGYSILCGIAAAYAYLYFWLFVFPKFLK